MYRNAFNLWAATPLKKSLSPSNQHLPMYYPWGGPELCEALLPLLLMLMGPVLCESHVLIAAESTIGQQPCYAGRTVLYDTRGHLKCSTRLQCPLLGVDTASLCISHPAQPSLHVLGGTSPGSAYAPGYLRWIWFCVSESLHTSVTFIHPCCFLEPLWTVNHTILARVLQTAQEVDTQMCSVKNEII